MLHITNCEALQHGMSSGQTQSPKSPKHNLIDSNFRAVHYFFSHCCFFPLPRFESILGGWPNLNSTWYFRNHIVFLRTIWFSVAKPKQYIVFHPRYKIPHTMFRVPCTMSVHCYLSKTSSMYYVGFTFRNRQRTQYIVWCTRLNIVFYVVYQVENYVGSGTANTHQKNTIWCGTYHVLFRFGHPPNIMILNWQLF